METTVTANYFNDSDTLCQSPTTPRLQMWVTVLIETSSVALRNTVHYICTNPNPIPFCLYVCLGLLTAPLTQKS
jgi:hypothetical protein